MNGMQHIRIKTRIGWISVRVRALRVMYLITLSSFQSTFIRSATRVPVKNKGTAQTIIEH